LLESVYEFALLKEMQLRNISAQYQVKVPLFYKGFETGKDFFIDILVDSKIIIQIKSVDILHPVHVVQLLSNLKLFDKRLGFLINFNVPLLKDGFKKMVNNYY
jgi:GxxExxY protein